MPVAIPIQGHFDGDMDNQKLTNLAAGSDLTDAVNKGQFDVALAAKADLIAGTVPVGQIPSLPYLSNGEKGAANGVATLDASGKVPAAQLPAVAPSASPFALRMTTAGAVNLNVTTEQVLDVPHGQAAAPNAQNMILIDVIQDNPAVDTAPVRWAAGYPIYDQAGSTSSMARIRVRFSAGAGSAATGRARIFFAL
jgi:hypothetical protein